MATTCRNFWQIINTSSRMLSFTNFIYFFQNPHYLYIQEHPLPFLYFHVSSWSINLAKKKSSCHYLIPKPRIKSSITFIADSSRTSLPILLPISTIFPFSNATLSISSQSSYLPLIYCFFSLFFISLNILSKRAANY